MNNFLVKTVPLLAFLAACNDSLSISGGERVGKVVIENPDQLSAKPGEVVTIHGSNLTEGIEAFVNGQPVPFQRVDLNTATIEMPASLDPGILKVTFSLKSKVITNISLMNGNSIESMKSVLIPLESVCDSFIVKNAEGDLARGKANCANQQNVCSESGQSDCKTTANFPAVKKSSLASKVLEGQTIAGVSGEASATCDN